MNSVRSLFILTLVNIFNYMDRYLLNALIPVLAAEFSLSHRQEGTLVAMFVVGYVLFSPIFGYVGDRYHRPSLMFAGIALWSLATAASGLASTLGLLLLARAFVGVGEASYGTIAPGYIKDCEPDPVRLNLRLSVFFTAIPVGSALGYVAGGLFTQHFSWRAAFLIASIPSFIAGCFLYFFPEVRRTTVAPVKLLEGLRRIVGIPALQYAIAGYVLNTFALTSVAAFVASYGQELGFELAEINSAFGLILVMTGFAGTLAGGKGASVIARRARKRRAHSTGPLLFYVAILSFAAVPFLGACFFAETRIGFLLLCACAELLIFAALAPINTIIVLESPPELVTLTQGTTIFLINVFGSFLGPQIIGIAADALGLSRGLQGTTAAMAACAWVWLAGARRCRLLPCTRSAL